MKDIKKEIKGKNKIQAKPLKTRDTNFAARCGDSINTQHHTNVNACDYLVVE